MHVEGHGCVVIDVGRVEPALALEYASDIGIVYGHAELRAEPSLTLQRAPQALLGLGVVVEGHIDVAKAIEGHHARLYGERVVVRQMLGGIKGFIVEIGGLGHKAYAPVDRPKVIERLRKEQAVVALLGGHEGYIMQGYGLRKAAGVAIRLAKAVGGKAEGGIVVRLSRFGDDGFERRCIGGQ